jgi:hypothetical protein
MFQVTLTPIRGSNRPAATGVEPATTTAPETHAMLSSRRLIAPVLALPLILLGCARASAQQTSPSVAPDYHGIPGRAARFMDNCNDRDNDDEVFCEVRPSTMAATSSLDIDGNQNGSVTVHGWSKPTIQVVAMIQTHANSQANARQLAQDTRVLTDDGRIHAETPRDLFERVRGHNGYVSVSFEVWAPRGTNLGLRASNGSITVDSVNSTVDLQTTNGSVRLRDVAGDIRGGTTNGSVGVDLSGDHWIGTGLDLRTINGGVRITMPSDYSAHLTTGTVNGGINIDFPITVQGRIGREISTQLGKGGAPIRVMTTNGGVSIRKR